MMRRWAGDTLRWLETKRVCKTYRGEQVSRLADRGGKFAKIGKIGNARSEDGDRSLLPVKGDRGEMCSWEEYSTGDLKQTRVPWKLRTRPGGSN